MSCKFLIEVIGCCVIFEKFGMSQEVLMVVKSVIKIVQEDGIQVVGNIIVGDGNKFIFVIVFVVMLFVSKDMKLMVWVNRFEDYGIFVSEYRSFNEVFL